MEEPESSTSVILDEMNLAKVEYYFADFLSAMETMEHGQGIPLHDHDEDVVIDLDGNDRVVPKRLPIPANVFFTGTVNIDETTHMFSRKVLDRANVIEFHDVDVRRHIGLSSPAKWSPALRLTDGTDVAKMLTQDRDRARERAVLSGKLAQRIVAIHDILAEYNLHFGYRVVDECARFLWLTKAHAGAEHLDGALDLQVLQKVLPKLAGNRSELQEPLERMLSYFATGEDSVLDLGDSKSIREYDLAGALMPLSAAKIRRMLERLTAVGFTSFVEWGTRCSRSGDAGTLNSSYQWAMPTNSTAGRRTFSSPTNPLTFPVRLRWSGLGIPQIRSSTTSTSRTSSG